MKRDVHLSVVCSVFLLSCVVFSGCVTVKEGAKCVLGISTKVLDDNGAAVPESQSAATEPVTFTNRYVAVSALPLTGGATGRQWLLVGGVIGGLAVLLIGAAEIWNNKKRLV